MFDKQLKSITKKVQFSLYVWCMCDDWWSFVNGHARSEVSVSRAGKNCSFALMWFKVLKNRSRHWKMHCCRTERVALTEKSVYMWLCRCISAAWDNWTNKYLILSAIENCFCRFTVHTQSGGKAFDGTRKSPKPVTELQSSKSSFPD